MGVAVGIDLGTTNSCMAVVQANRARVVADAAGRRIHPSVVSFPPEGEVLAGHPAKERQIIDASNTIYSFKRLIGRDLTSGEMLQVLDELPYEVRAGADQIPAIQSRGREISLPEVSAMMLRHMRELCTETLGVEIKEAVITVPANFNDVQRSSTKVAGRIAGFNVLRILNEPTAAALAYGFGGELTERIAIFDFGGGTFDITIVELADDIFEVLSTAGDTYLGGDDFDKLIVQEMRRDFRREHDLDLGNDPVAMQRIRSVAEKVKCQLSTIDEVQATLREIADGPDGSPLDFHFKLTRKRFESLIEPLVSRSVKVCEEALKLASMDRSSLDNLVLVGGTTRIPLVRQRVAEHFGMKPRIEINPDEVVAIGAAIQAFSLTGDQLPEELPQPEPKQKMQDRSGLTDAIRASTLANKPSQPPPPQHKPAGTAAYGAPKPFPLGPLPQKEPGSLVQKTMHGMPSAPGPKKGTAPPPPPPAITTPLEPEPEMVGEEAETALDPAGLALDVKRSAGSPPDSNHLGLDVKRQAAPESSQFDPALDPDSLALDVKRQAQAADDSDADPFADMDLDSESLGLDVKRSAQEDAAREEVSDELPAVLEAPPPAPVHNQPSGTQPAFSSGEGLAFDGLSDGVPEAESLDDRVIDDEGLAEDAGGFGVLADVPIPGSEGDEVVGLPTPVDPSIGEPEPEPFFQEEPRHSSIPIPDVTSAQSALLLDVTPRALGIATAGGFCDTCIERNAAIPVEQSRLFNTSTDNQTEVSIDVYQGESRRVVENTQLGQILLTNIRPAPRGEIKIRVTFEIDTDGILGVSARNEETGEAQTTRIVLTGGMDDEMVEELVQKYAEE